MTRIAMPCIHIPNMSRSVDQWQDSERELEVA
jgi:hypothetical protein